MDKKNETKPLPVNRGVFLSLRIRRQKTLTCLAQLDAIDSRSFAADFSQQEFLSLKCALSPLNSKQQHKLVEEPLQLLKIQMVTTGFTFSLPINTSQFLHKQAIWLGRKKKKNQQNTKHSFLFTLSALSQAQEWMFPLGRVRRVELVLYKQVKHISKPVASQVKGKKVVNLILYIPNTAHG